MIEQGNKVSGQKYCESKIMRWFYLTQRSILKEEFQSQCNSPHQNKFVASQGDHLKDGVHSFNRYIGTNLVSLQFHLIML